MIADLLRHAAGEVRFNLRIMFWAQAWFYGEATYLEIPPDVRQALECISIQHQGHGGGDTVGHYDLELEDVGVPDGEGETWGEAAQRLCSSRGDSCE